jgi:hypothetical protein
MNSSAGRLAPIAAALAVLYASGATADVRAVAMPDVFAPGTHAGLASLFGALRDVREHVRAPVHVPVVIPVTSCADDGTDGTLRSVIALTGDGDTVDMSALTCSAITLAQGAIPALPDHLTLRGPGAARLAIDGAGSDRVIVHYGYYSLRIEDLTVRNGYNRVAGYHVAGGACVLSNAYVTLDHSTVSGCRAIGEGAYGGGILARRVTMYTSTLSDNLAQGTPLRTLTASYGGGAFAYRGTAALYDSTVSGNRALIDPTNRFGNYDTGAGIFTDDGGVAVRSTISGNTTDGTGGGIASHGAFLLSDSTVSGNAAQRGGGIFLRTSAAITVDNSTIAFNQAGAGGGMYFSSSVSPSATLQSAIVADNASVDIASQLPLSVDGANSLVTSVGAGVALPPDTLTVDPSLLPLANNGGPTLTHALAAASPARDAGNNTAGLVTDQRGRARVVGAAADIGAVEMEALVALAPVPAVSAWVGATLAALLACIGARRRRARFGVASGPCR